MKKWEQYKIKQKWLAMLKNKSKYAEKADRCGKEWKNPTFFKDIGQKMMKKPKTNAVENKWNMETFWRI